MMSVADPRGCHGHAPNSFIFMQFSHKIFQIKSLAHPFWGWGPSFGYSGSTTECLKYFYNNCILWPWIDPGWSIKYYQKSHEIKLSFGVPSKVFKVYAFFSCKLSKYIWVPPLALHPFEISWIHFSSSAPDKSNKGKCKLNIWIFKLYERKRPLLKEWKFSGGSMQDSQTGGRWRQPII